MPLTEEDVANAERVNDETDQFIAVSERSMLRLIRERDQMREQVKTLQRDMGKLVESALSRQVRAFHQRFGHPVAITPHVPEEEQVRFRLSLITEEFSELLAASLGFDPDSPMAVALDTLRAGINGPYPYQRAPVNVDLPEFADALGDLDYVIEGTRAVFGIDGRPIALEIQRANMSKDPVYVAEKDSHHCKPNPKAKPVKPASWTPPDIKRCLVEQGWREEVCDAREAS